MSSTQPAPYMSSVPINPQIGLDSPNKPQKMQQEPNPGQKILRRRVKSDDLKFEQDWGHHIDKQVDQEMHEVRMLPLYCRRSWSCCFLQGNASTCSMYCHIHHLMLLDLLVRLIASSQMVLNVRKEYTSREQLPSLDAIAYVQFGTSWSKLKVNLRTKEKAKIKRRKSQLSQMQPKEPVFIEEGRKLRDGKQLPGFGPISSTQHAPTS